MISMALPTYLSSGYRRPFVILTAHLPHHMERQLPISHFTLEVLVLVFGDRVLLAQTNLKFAILLPQAHTNDT